MRKPRLQELNRMFKSPNREFWLPLSSLHYLSKVQLPKGEVKAILCKKKVDTAGSFVDTGSWESAILSFGVTETV